MFLKLSLISFVILLNVINSFGDINETIDQNKAFQTSHQIIDSSHKSNKTDSSFPSMMSRIHITNGFIIRSLFVVMVIAVSLLFICLIRTIYWGRRWKLSKKSKEWSHPKYDSLPTAAINDSVKKNAFVLNDSEDEDFTIFDVNHRLMTK